MKRYSNSFWIKHSPIQTNKIHTQASHFLSTLQKILHIKTLLIEAIAASSASFLFTFLKEFPEKQMNLCLFIITHPQLVI